MTTSKREPPRGRPGQASDHDRPGPNGDRDDQPASGSLIRYPATASLPASAAVPAGSVQIGAALCVALPLSRLSKDIGYEPLWDTERAAADYIAWLRAGNKR